MAMTNGMDSDDFEALAQGLVAAMAAVSRVHRSVFGDAWESSSAAVVVRSLRPKDSDSDRVVDVVDRTLGIWPTLSESLFEDDGTDSDDGLVDLMIAVTAGRRSLTSDEYESYSWIVRNIAHATAAAAAEDGLLRVGGPRVSDQESELISSIDSILG